MGLAEGGRMRVFKGSLRRLLSSKLTTCCSWTPVTMWFQILFLALSLGGIGEMGEAGGVRALTLMLPLALGIAFPSPLAPATS